jgi:hypothetical protein
MKSHFKKSKVEKKKKEKKLDYSKDVEPFASTVHHFIERKIKYNEKHGEGKKQKNINPKKRMASEN